MNQIARVREKVEKKHARLGLIVLVIYVAAVLFLSLRGVGGNPSIGDLNTEWWKEKGSFDLSPERGRFALLYSVVENKSLFFSVPVARFSVPDLGFVDGNYVSLFAPGVSFLVAPGYLLGKLLGFSLVGTFSVIALFALLNVLLIRKISMLLGASSVSAALGSLVFIFATPALSYAVTLYQHHISTLIILSCLYILIRYKSFWAMSLVWFLCALSIPIDNPNFFLLFPVGIYALGRFVSVEDSKKKVNIRFNVTYIFSFLFAVLPLLLFIIYNNKVNGSPTKLSGAVGNVQAIDTQGRPTVPDVFNKERIGRYLDPGSVDRNPVKFFRTRNFLNGVYIHLFSPDRGLVYFAPILILGVVGIYFVYRRGKNLVLYNMIISVILVNLFLYSMWGDPWGGWGFGSRYLIPSYALLSIFISLFMAEYGKRTLVLLAFLVLTAYSSFVSVSGAITSIANPPKIQVLSLEEVTGVEEKYTYERNVDHVKAGRVKTFVYQSLPDSLLSGWGYFGAVYGFVMFGIVSAAIYRYRFEDKRNV